MASIVNSTAGFNLCCNIEMEELAIDLQVDYQPDGYFSAGVLRKFNGNCSANIYASGKVVITGARSKSESSDRAKGLVVTLVTLGHDARVRYFKMNNFDGALLDLRHIHLPGIQSANSELSSYDPDLFP